MMTGSPKSHPGGIGQWAGVTHGAIILQFGKSECHASQWRRSFQGLFLLLLHLALCLLERKLFGQMLLLVLP